MFCCFIECFCIKLSSLSREPLTHVTPKGPFHASGYDRYDLSYLTLTHNLCYIKFTMKSNINCPHTYKPHYAKGMCRRCYSRAKYHANPEKYIKGSMKWMHKHPETQLLVSARGRAKQRGMECTLKVGDIKIPNLCPVLGIPLQPRSGKFSHNSPSIDRIDNDKGYTKENIIIVSFRANSIKKDASLEELQKIAAFYSQLQDRLVNGA